MTTLTQIDAGRVLDKAPHAVISQLKKFPRRLVLAGGCIRSVLADEPIADFDLFVSALDAYAIAAASGFLIATCKDGTTIVTENAITIPAIKTQVVIKRRFDIPQDVIKGFDFTVCRAAIWWENGEWLSDCHQDFYEDLRARRLRYTGSSFDPADSLLRVLKFYKRGYQITNASLANLVEALTDDLQGTQSVSRELLKRFGGAPDRLIRSQSTIVGG